MKEEKVLNCFIDYKESIKKGLFFKGFVELGESYNLILFCDLKNYFKKISFNKITIYSSNKENQVIVEENFKKKLNQLINIISIGDIYNEDEILLILTMRFELSLVNKILQLHNIKIYNYYSEDIDEKISSIQNKKGNSKPFTIALNLMYKNWENAMLDSPW